MKALGAGNIQVPHRRSKRIMLRSEGKWVWNEGGGKTQKDPEWLTPETEPTSCQDGAESYAPNDHSGYKSNIIKMWGRKAQQDTKVRSTCSWPRNELRHSGRPLATELEAGRGGQVSHSWGTQAKSCWPESEAGVRLSHLWKGPREATNNALGQVCAQLHPCLRSQPPELTTGGEAGTWRICF